MPAMTHPVIPIRPACEGLPPSLLVPTRLSGEPQRVNQVLDALVGAVQGHVAGIGPTSRWLRELRVDDTEAFVFIAPGLGCEGMESAEVAFDTLRRVLPDTDIYVSAAAA